MDVVANARIVVKCPKEQQEEEDGHADCCTTAKRADEIPPPSWEEGLGTTAAIARTGWREAVSL